MTTIEVCIAGPVEITRTNNGGTIRTPTVKWVPAHWAREYNDVNEARQAIYWHAADRPRGMYTYRIVRADGSTWRYMYEVRSQNVVRVVPVGT